MCGNQAGLGQGLHSRWRRTGTFSIEQTFFSTVITKQYSKTYSKNFWFNTSDEKLTNSVFEIMENNYRFRALMVQKISYMEVKIISMSKYIEKRNLLIKLLKNHITDEN